MSKTKENKMDSRSLEKRLSAVRETSEDIQTLSRWCLQHKNHHHSIIQAWSRSVRKSKVPHRLTLFYVCNDIVQNSRRKKLLDLVQHFATAIKEAAPLVRDEKIRPKIIRIFNIWEERGIYDAKFISDLTEIVENVGTVNASENEIVLSSFQPVQLVEGIRGVAALEKTTESLMTDLKNQDFSLTDEEINQLRQTVKERGTSRERMEEFEEAVIALECYMASVQKEVEERTQVVTLLEQAEIFYETQRGEAKMVANAYKNFGNRVKTLKTKLTEKMKTLPEPSPVPSPTVDAPSPENSDDEDLSLPESGNSGFDSFLNSSKFAELAKDALGGTSGDLESRLSAIRKSEASPKKSSPKTSASQEIKDVQSPKLSTNESTMDNIQVWDVEDSLDGYEAREVWDSRNNRETRDTRESRSSRDPDERRESQEIRDVRDSWDRDSADRRDYVSLREHRNSRSSRDSRDSRDGASECREAYRGSSRDRATCERDYTHKSRDREYSHTPTSSYDSPVHPPKDLKPMSAAELLDTFGKAYLSKSSGGSGSTSSSVKSPVPLPVPVPVPVPVPPPYEPSKPPNTSTPNHSIPDLSRPPPSLSIPLPPSNPPTTDSPSPYTPMPVSAPTSYTPKSLYTPQPYPPPPESSPKSAYPPPPTPGEQPPYPPYETQTAWVPPPPPPPPPPEVLDDGTGGSGNEYEILSRSFSQGWPDYEQYSNPGDVNDDDESDDRNWGEPPGNEELEALTSDTPSSPPTFEKGFSGVLLPPPLPPAFCAPSRSNLRELASEGEDSDHRTNLVSIKPKGRDSDYRCYDYSFLSDHTAQSKAVPTPSIHALFASGDDLDLRVKKPGVKQSNDDSGSDMDISASESDDMDISDESGKEGNSNNKKTSESKSTKKSQSKENKTEALKKVNNNKETKPEKPAGSTSTAVTKSVTTTTSTSAISVIARVSKTADTTSITTKPNNKSGIVDVSAILSVIGNTGALKSEGKKAEKRKSVDSDESEGYTPQPLRIRKESGNDSNGDISDKDYKASSAGRGWYKDFKKSDKEKSPVEEYIPTVIAKTGGRGNTGRDYSNNRSCSEKNVIDVMKSLDEEFNQQRGKGNSKGQSHNRGGGYRGGYSPQQGNGGYYGSPQNYRGRGRGSPNFYPPHGRGRGSFGPPYSGRYGDFQHGTPPYNPSGRGFRGSESYGGGRGGRRGGRGGRGWW
ncbi:uncharacterized protein LOC121873725 isoform X2 [Homarus americanus]|uniref:Regulation of nuclear pre-mRNA domain-containing protein 2-like n=1 Tax=Homarus americanus TaxID=6706 RepID=A0A8J5JQX0_HOMAM|nr:uncharacterized protein LOC121873725 isoform X2 [Homarus americanus]KAG7162627.1 Regulation of nuclear pre-mRNA domain-containing protein 2-like [Homarus americanus]